MPITTAPAKSVTVGIFRLPHAPQQLPAYATPGAAGMDVCAAIAESLTLQPLARHLVPTGFILEIPEGYECQLRARSGLSIKHGVTLINGVGTVDWDYRHEVKVALVNLSQDAYTIHPGERIAQMVFAPVLQVALQAVEEVAMVAGRAGGFGSTGRF